MIEMQPHRSGTGGRRSTFRRPYRGYNHNVKYKGNIFHIQTEDSGDDKKHIFTHIFHGGVVIYSKKIEYRAGTQPDGRNLDIPRLMRRSHQSTFRVLVNRELDETIDRLVGSHDKASGTAVPDTTSTTGHSEQTPGPNTSAHSQRIKTIQEKLDMANVADSLKKIEEETVGTLGVALVDYESGMCLGTRGTGVDLEIAAAGNMEVVKAKMKVMRDLEIEGGIEDILITLQGHYHIMRPIGTSMFLYLAIDRKQGNLAMARRKLTSVGDEIKV